MNNNKNYVELLNEYIKDVEMYGHRHYFKQHFKYIKKNRF